MNCDGLNCFDCPYVDCINDKGIIHKRGRKALPPEIKKQHRNAYSRKYNAEHREEINAKNKLNYRKRKEKETQEK